MVSYIDIRWVILEIWRVLKLTLSPVLEKNTLKKPSVIRVKTRSQKKLSEISKKHFFNSFSCHPK